MKQDTPEMTSKPRRRRRRRRKPTEEKQPAKKKVRKPEAIKAGSLREQVKAGNFTAREVLDWLDTQKGPHSVKFIDWLRRKAKES